MVKIINKQPITLAEMKAEIDKMKTKDELNFRVGRVEAYLNEVMKLRPEKANELKERLKEMNIPRLKDEHIVVLVNLLPTTVEEASSYLDQYPLTLSKENLKKIVDLIKEYC